MFTRLEIVGIVAFCIVGTIAFQTMFDLYDPAHCILVCPETQQ